MLTECPFCNLLHQVDNKLDGQIINCSKCKQEFYVEPYRRKQTLAYENELKKTYTSKKEPCNNIHLNNTQICACMYCGEQILSTAKKCKHCGEFFDKSEKKTKKGPDFFRWASILFYIIIGLWLYGFVNAYFDVKDGQSLIGYKLKTMNMNMVSKHGYSTYLNYLTDYSERCSEIDESVKKLKRSAEELERLSK